MGKKIHRIANEVKADIIRRIKEEGIPVAQAAKEHGLQETTVYGWMGAGIQGAPSWSEFAKIQKQNKELLEWVGELTLRIRISRSHPGCPWENGYQESFYGKCKVDLGDPNRFQSWGELAAEIYRTIWDYNHARIHSALKISPVVFAAKNKRDRLQTHQLSV